MSLKHTGEGDLTIIDEFEGGVGWIAYPDEPMQRAAHGIESGDELWIIDPVDTAGVDDIFADYSPIGGVVVLLDRHLRDAAAIASRHNVAVHIPTWMTGVEDALPAPVEQLDGELGSYRVDRLLDNRFWQEAILYDGDTLVVPEAVGRTDYCLVGNETLGVHPMLRPRPPKTLTEYTPTRLLLGHGTGIFENAPETIQQAIKASRRNMLSLYGKTLRAFVGI